jgi:osmotically-inducible protein OsmY
VHSEAQRRAAEADTWAVFGVDDVLNEIDVRA